MSTAITDHEIFLRRVTEAQQTMEGAELAARIAAIHSEILQLERANLREEASEARDAAAQTAAAASLQWHLNAPVLETLQLTARRRGEISALAGHREMVLRDIAKLCQGAEANGGTVSARALREILGRPRPAESAWRPGMFGFTPSQQYRVGYFRTEDTAVVRALPFAGYAVWEEAPDRMPQQQSAFLFDGEVLARPQIQADYGLILQHLE